jgi:alpha-1,3-rhamnosyl/mannosyltransferase
MDVLLDARLGRKITGIGYYTVNLAQEFGALAPSVVRPMVGLNHRRKFRKMGLSPWSPLFTSMRYSRLPAADVIHGPNFHAPVHPSARRVATIHDLSYLRLPECHPPGMSERLDRLVRDSLEETALFLCDSRATYEDFVQTYEFPRERCRVVYLGVSKRFSQRLDRDVINRALGELGIPRRYLLHVGAMVPRKDLVTLLKSFEMVSSEYPDLDLVLVGNKTLRWASCWPDMAAWLASRPELAARVHVLNYVRDAWLPALYQGAAINVATPLWEGFGLTVLEAFASRTPVVTSNVSSLPEIGAEIARYGVPRQPETYAEAIRETLDPRNAQDTEARVAGGAARATEFTWAETARGTLDGYRDACNVSI